jgi:hypothetical protein
MSFIIVDLSVTWDCLREEMLLGLCGVILKLDTLSGFLKWDFFMICFFIFDIVIKK